ncbi:MAG: M15 family metallopeptidase [Bacteroidales bacterium]|nr:M15 family metallopeptidase [Bacteroidales bacterium]
MKKVLTIVLFLILGFVGKGYAQKNDTLVFHRQLFISGPVPEQVQQRMIGKSMPANIPISFNELRYLQLPYYDFEGNIQIGEMVCNKAIADDLLDIFRILFHFEYPFQSIRLVDDFDGDDEASMQANNTSCFNYRNISGSQLLSKHALGRAIDINPLQNPWVRGSRTYPSTATPYRDRSRDFPHKIDKQDLCYRVFKWKGFFWGGEWKTAKDYQHFHK